MTEYWYGQEYRCYLPICFAQLSNSGISICTCSMTCRCLYLNLKSYMMIPSNYAFWPFSLGINSSPLYKLMYNSSSLVKKRRRYRWTEFPPFYYDLGWVKLLFGTLIRVLKILVDAFFEKWKNTPWGLVGSVVDRRGCRWDCVASRFAFRLPAIRILFSRITHAKYRNCSQ